MRQRIVTSIHYQCQLTTNGDVVIISESISEPVSERNGHAANTTPTVRGVYDPRPLYPDSGGAAGGQINTSWGIDAPGWNPGSKLDLKHSTVGSLTDPNG